MNAAPDPMIGTTIGNYEVLSKLGQGGVGAVYLGRSTTGQHVAIKKLHDRLTTQDRARSRFLREAEVLSRLKHPGIVQVLDFLQLPEGFFMVLEFVRGETLESGVRRLGSFAWERAVPWFNEALDSLEYAHNQGIIHRDVKPANMLIQMNGKMKLLDFGMAKLQDARQQLTAPGMTLGTIAYMSKEQLLGKPLDARSDFYSLGVALYEVVTGHLPFWSENDRELAIQIARTKPQLPSIRSPKLAGKPEEVILKAMNKAPEDRFQDVASFKAAM
ncbi:MAG: serine/threonine-protein kinase, partial [Planctomycetota bacterium]|nr:serine/threonine-protein kinase [Planctomycetota bacterium]